MFLSSKTINDKQVTSNEISLSLTFVSSMYIIIFFQQLQKAKHLWLNVLKLPHASQWHDFTNV